MRTGLIVDSRPLVPVLDRLVDVVYLHHPWSKAVDGLPRIRQTVWEILGRYLELTHSNFVGGVSVASLLDEYLNGLAASPEVLPELLSYIEGCLKEAAGIVKSPLQKVLTELDSINEELDELTIVPNASRNMAIIVVEGSEYE